MLLNGNGNLGKDNFIGSNLESERLDVVPGLLVETGFAWFGNQGCLKDYPLHSDKLIAVGHSNEKSFIESELSFLRIKTLNGGVRDDWTRKRLV